MKVKCHLCKNLFDWANEEERKQHVKEKCRGYRKVFEIPSSKEKVTHCPDCKTKIVDEFPEVDYVNCSGCSRIFNRVGEEE